MNRTRRVARWVSAVLAAEAAMSGVVLERIAQHARSAEMVWVIVGAAAGATLLPTQAWLVWRSWRVLGDEAAESESTARMLDNFVRASHEWVWAFRGQGMLTYCSPSCEEILGYRPDELVGTSALALLHPSAVEEVTSAIAQASAERRGWSGLVMHAVARDGSDRWLETSGRPVLDEHGRVAGYEGTSLPVASPEDTRRHRAEARQRIRAVIDRAELAIALQPIVSLATGQLSGYEALARFPHGRPDLWFRDAASVGLGTELELLAVRAALANLGRTGASAYLSVNVSPQTLATPRLLAMLERVPLDRLVFEVTEHATVEDYAALELPVTRLRRGGARIAVDDAGAGYSSFRHILQLRPDIIKLDHTLIRRIDADLALRALAASVVTVAVQLDATVVAEGVETEAELEAVTDLRLDAAQGYLLDRPSTDPAVWEQWGGRRWRLSARPGRADQGSDAR